MCLREVTTQGRSLLSIKAFKQGQHLLKINTQIHTHYAGEGFPQMGQPGAQACLGFLESASLGNWQLIQLNQTELCFQLLGDDKSSSFQARWQ